jgi:hypothetical protein
MGEQTVHKTFKYKLKPTPEQERAMVVVLRCCVNSITPLYRSAGMPGTCAR